MKTSICSFSFHRLYGAGKMDIFEYIQTSKKLGCSHLQPWCVHFARGLDDNDIKGIGYHPGNPDAPAFMDPPTDRVWMEEIKAAAHAAGLDWELIAVDRAAMCQETPAEQQMAKKRALGWMETAAFLGAEGVRVDSGGPEILRQDQFEVIRKGYTDLIARGKEMNVSVYVENHWGSCSVPENIVQFKKEIPGLKYLFDTNNWPEGRMQEGWDLCASLADATHAKTGRFDVDGNDPDVDIARALRMVKAGGFNGVWGVESVPKDGDEIGAAEKTLALIGRTVA